MHDIPATVPPRSMPEAARCNAIEVSQRVLCSGSKIEARDQIEQPLMGAIRDRDRQRFLVKRYSRRPKSSATGTRPVAQARPCSKSRVFAGGYGKSASRDAAAKATHANRSCQPLQITEEAIDSYSRPRFRATVNSHPWPAWLCSHPQAMPQTECWLLRPRQGRQQQAFR